jgi:RNA 3'-terminal phosphate cyclase-like protein
VSENVNSAVSLQLSAAQSLGITLMGLTNTPLDESVDVFRAAAVPLFKDCGVSVSISAKHRSVGPEGKAAVLLSVEALRAIEQPIRLTEEGLVRRVRGVAWTVNMAPQHATAAFSSAKGVLLKLLADVQIFTDVVSARAAPVRFR